MNPRAGFVNPANTRLLVGENRLAASAWRHRNENSDIRIAVVRHRTGEVSERW